MIGKDTKDAYMHFKDFFDFFEKVKREGLPAGIYGPRILPMLVWSPQDLSSLWKCLNTGSGAKKNCHSYFCHLCPCSSRDILFFTVGANRCERCIRNDAEKCYHWEVGDEDAVEKFQQDLQREMAEYLSACRNSLQDIKKKSKIKYNLSAIDAATDVYNIDFQPGDADSDEGMEEL